MLGKANLTVNIAKIVVRLMNENKIEGHFMSTVNRLFIVSGMVQGVGFRYQTAHHGLSFGVTGYAKNLNNGDVEVLVCGEDDKVKAFHLWLKKGPRTAYVDSVVEQPTDKSIKDDFMIL